MESTIAWRHEVAKGQTGLLALGAPEGLAGADYWTNQHLDLPVGHYLQGQGGQAWFQVQANTWLFQSRGPSRPALWIRALQDLGPQPEGTEVSVQQRGYSLAWITLSDKAFRGTRQDSSGPEIESLLVERLPISLVRGYVLADEKRALQGLLNSLSLVDQFDMVFTTGGTGVSPRDITPEVTLRSIDRRLLGFERAMTLSSLDKTPFAMISRAVVGVSGRSLICNLPGSPKGVKENLEAILPALQHALDKIQGDSSDCASTI